MRRSDALGVALAAPRRYGGLSAVDDRWIVAGAFGTAIGAIWAPGVSWWWGTPLIVAGVASRARVLIPVGLLLLAAASMCAQLDRLDAAASGDVEGDVVLAADPRWRAGALVVPFSATIDGERFRWEGWARGPAAWALESAAMGERWRLSATAEPASAADRNFMWSRHLAGGAQIHSAQRIDDGAAAFRVANRLRDRVSASATSLSQRDAALLAGFVYGDDRGQLPEVVHDFRATSLTHLLAVSGSNVAFVLLLFAPLLVRLRPFVRLGAVGLLLAQFAVLTRGEPSVLRACVLATLAVGAHAIGRRASAPRLLATAVIVLLVVDPLLVRSVGFQLSVAATAAIVLGAGRVARLLRGPPWLRLALAATLTAQAGVLPVQLAVFGSLPLASIPANVLAGPIAGPAMVWGLVAGLAGGVAGDAVAAILHLPTRLMLGWVAAVARWGAGLGWPYIEAPEIAPIIAVAGVCTAVALWGRGRMAGVGGLLTAAFAIGVWAVASTHLAPPPQGAHLSVHDDEPVVVVIDRPDAARALGQLATAGIGDIDVLVVRSASRAGREAVRALATRHGIRSVLAPERLGGTVPYTPVREPVTVSGLQIAPAGERLAATPAVASNEWQAEP